MNVLKEEVVRMANVHLVMESVVFVSVLILISHFFDLNKAIKMVSRYLGPKE